MVSFGFLCLLMSQLLLLPLVTNSLRHNHSLYHHYRHNYHPLAVGVQPGHLPSPAGPSHCCPSFRVCWAIGLQSPDIVSKCEPQLGVEVTPGNMFLPAAPVESAMYLTFVASCMGFLVMFYLYITKKLIPSGSSCAVPCPSVASIKVGSVSMSNCDKSPSEDKTASSDSGSSKGRRKRLQRTRRESLQYTLSNLEPSCPLLTDSPELRSESRSSSRTLELERSRTEKNRSRLHVSDPTTPSPTPDGPFDLSSDSESGTEVLRHLIRSVADLKQQSHNDPLYREKRSRHHHIQQYVPSFGHHPLPLPQYQPGINYPGSSGQPTLNHGPHPRMNRWLVRQDAYDFHPHSSLASHVQASHPPYYNSSLTYTPPYVTRPASSASSSIGGHHPLNSYYQNNYPSSTYGDASVDRSSTSPQSLQPADPRSQSPPIVEEEDILSSSSPPSSLASPTTESTITNFSSHHHYLPKGRRRGSSSSRRSSLLTPTSPKALDTNLLERTEEIEETSPSPVPPPEPSTESPKEPTDPVTSSSPDKEMDRSRKNHSSESSECSVGSERVSIDDDPNLITHQMSASVPPLHYHHYVQHHPLHPHDEIDRMNERIDMMHMHSMIQQSQMSHHHPLSRGSSWGHGHGHPHHPHQVHPMMMMQPRHPMSRSLTRYPLNRMPSEESSCSISTNDSRPPLLTTRSLDKGPPSMSSMSGGSSSMSDRPFNFPTTLNRQKENGNEKKEEDKSKNEVNSNAKNRKNSMRRRMMLKAAHYNQNSSSFEEPGDVNSPCPRIGHNRVDRSERGDRSRCLSRQTTMSLPGVKEGGDMSSSIEGNTGRTSRGEARRSGLLDMSHAYDAPSKKMHIVISDVTHVSARERGWATHVLVRMSLLPGKKHRVKTRASPISEGKAEFNESFTLTRINPEDIVALSLRFRLYSCEKMRRLHMIGEVTLPLVTSKPFQSETKLTLPLETRTIFTRSESRSSDMSTLTRSDSTGSAHSLSLQPELLIGLGYNGTMGNLHVEILKGSQYRGFSLSRPPDTYTKLFLVSSTGQEIGRKKTSVRKAQINPLFRETFIFQVPLFQLPDVTLMISVYKKQSMKRKEMIGWCSMGLNSSGDEETSHWNDMKDSKGEQVLRWHVLISNNNNNNNSTTTSPTTHPPMNPS